MSQDGAGDQTGRITTIDLRYRGIDRCVAAFLVATSTGEVLVECGPARCLDALRSGLADAGSGMESIEHLFLTHIHLDHAGATGACTASGMTAHVHERGAIHLVDPDKLMASANRVFGKALEEDLGSLVASRAANVAPASEGYSVRIGDTSFTAIETPGHARHHHAWLVENGDARHLFSGDAAGMCLPGTRFATLPLVAPEFDLVTWLDSIDRLRTLEYDKLWLTHFGVIEDHRDFLDHVEARLRSETEFVRDLLTRAGQAPNDDLIGPYRTWHDREAARHGVDPDLLQVHCTDQHFRANLSGVRRWLERADRTG